VINDLYILPPVLGLNYVSTIYHGTTIQLNVSSDQAHSSCPLCKELSNQAHSYYSRSLSDLPVAGHTVRITLQVRKFFCKNPHCSRKIFTERFSSQIDSYSRRFNRSTEVLENIAIQSGSSKGARISEVVACKVSASTLLRIMHRMTAIKVNETSGVIGIDDWAYKKGKSYGTIIVDLSTRKVIDLLPDREAETLSQWLIKHPEVGIVSRDRASAYALGIRNGSPAAIQVADRFHLLVNLREAFQKTLHKYSNILKACFNEFTNPHEAKPLPEEKQLPQTGQACFSGNVSPDRQFKFEKAKQLHKQGYKLKTIARVLKAGGKTIRKYIQLDTLSGRQAPVVSSALTNFPSFEAWLIAHYRPGVTYKALFQAIEQQGFNGKYTSFCERMNQLVKRRNHAGHSALEAEAMPKLSPVKIWSTSKLAFMALNNANDLKPTEEKFLDFLYSKAPVIKQTAALVVEFKVCIRSTTYWC
jgi:transposase